MDFFNFIYGRKRRRTGRTADCQCDGCIRCAGDGETVSRLSRSGDLSVDGTRDLSHEKHVYTKKEIEGIRNGLTLGGATNKVVPVSKIAV